ncbi:MAG: hypothetical protein H6584_03085 [Flavobacteriales bacterium]|nr:hypothetical protein [Flavobacteriales bacterium]
MKSAITYKSKQLAFLLLKIAIVSLAFVFIYFQLQGKSNGDWLGLFTDLTSHFSVSALFIIFILSIINWTLETLKWQNLVSFFQNISFAEALQQTLSGLTLGIFTPNGIGEYGAKVAYYPKDRTKQILLLNFLTNGIQMVFTTGFGIIGLTFISSLYFEVLPKHQLVLTATVFISGLTFLFLFRNAKIFGVSLIDTLLKIKSIPTAIHLKNTLLGFVRYMVFCHQYYFILALLGVDLSYTITLNLLFSMYLLASLMPNLQALDVAIKGSIGMYLFGLFGINEWVVLFAASVMWIFNYLLPSTIGSIFVLKYQPQWK